MKKLIFEKIVYENALIKINKNLKGKIRNGQFNFSPS